MPSPSPELVSKRLAKLRSLHVPESVEAARARLSAERPAERFVDAVQRRLNELRALSALSSYLHDRR